MINFSKSEKSILNYFNIGQPVKFREEIFKIVKAGKPKCRYGEPKTDIYILLENETSQKEIKISYKKSNADFLENKIKAQRAEQLFGEDWQSVIKQSVQQIQRKFLEKPLIYKSPLKKTGKGSITLGWKFELMNKLSGELSGKIPLSYMQCIDVYSGNNLPKDKRDAEVEGEIIPDSGIANYILLGNEFQSAEEVLANMKTIAEYVKSYPEIYFACKALNYRSFDDKWDGDRPLAVQVQWKITDNKLTPELCFDSPLINNGNAVCEQLKKCLMQLQIKNTDEINEKNTVNHCIYNDEEKNESY